MPPHWPWRLVTFDIDGTLTRGHGWRYLAEKTGRLSAFERANTRFFRKETGEDEHLQELANLAAGCRVDEVDEILAETPKIGGIIETIADLRRRGAKVALLTHNPEYVCEWYRRTFGFDDFEGTATNQVVDGRIEAAGSVHADKVGGLARLLARLDRSPAESAHVGDSWADAAVFPKLGGGVALNSRLADVRAAADLALELSDLRGLVAPLGSLRPRAV